MAKGYPDWRPPSAPGAFDVTVVQIAAIGDITTSPGAGFRQVLYGIMACSDPGGTALVVIDEVDAANVFIRRLFLTKQAAGSTVVMQYFGVPLGNNNHMRLTFAPGTTVYITVILRTEAV